MDNHHEMVRLAQLKSQNAPPRLYFAYSTALDRAALDEWKLQHGYADFVLPEGEVAEALDVALVWDFPSRFWGGRVAGLGDKAGASVWGRLFEIPGPRWPIVQHKEGVISGMCVERGVKLRAGGRELQATAFVTRPDRVSFDGPVSERFVEALVRGAGAAGLPPTWIDELRRSARGGTP